MDSAARLGVMNLYLHGIGGNRTNIVVDDSLRAQPSDHYDMVLTNPPFGRTSTLTYVNTEGKTQRQSLVVERPNHRQPAIELLAARPHAAENQRDRGHRTTRQRAVRGRRRRDHPKADAAGMRRPHPAAAAHRRVLRPGVKANVLFFDRKPASETPWTRDLWIYDLRTNQHFTLKTNLLTRAHLDDFVSCYHAADRTQRVESEWFRRFTYEELTQRDKANLDIFWLRDESLEDSENLPPPDVIAEEIMEDLRAALEQLEEIATDLGVEELL